MSAADDDRVERALARIEEGALVAVVGPTGSGKTALAVALAARLGGEIVSADSVQIYRAFDIGSGKPTAEELSMAPHHLVGVVDPLEPMDAARWAEMARRAIDDVRGRGKVPIVCGGTFLWTKALLFGLADAPAADEAARARHRAIADAEGRPALHARLRDVDSVSAARLHPNDFIRVSRALEVFELTGKPMSALQAEHAFARPREKATLLAAVRTSDELTLRIEARVRGFLDAGWIEETRGLLAQGYGDARAMASVGYKEVRAHLEGRIAEADLALAVVRATRVFARRQRTWLRSADVVWL